MMAIGWLAGAVEIAIVKRTVTLISIAIATQTWVNLGLIKSFQEMVQS
jgi:hypothetical protein